MHPRLSYEDSCRKLQGEFLEKGEFPPMPDRIPTPNDQTPGVTFFRTRVKGDLSNLSLPRTFFGRSEIAEASFRNTDLAESCLCWNDFLDVDFTEAVLADADMRASLFRSVSFKGADLRRADLRRSTFQKCSFDGANLENTIVTLSQKLKLPLSRDQRSRVHWTFGSGREPDGG